MQVFPANQPGIYINKLQLGPIRADLSANYKFSASDKIDVNFIDIAAYLGPLRLVQKVTHRYHTVTLPKEQNFIIVFGCRILVVGVGSGSCHTVTMIFASCTPTKGIYLF